MDLESENAHVLLGKNGAGKTNILESIAVLSEGGSFLGVSDECMIRWGEGYFRASAKIVSDSGEKSSLEAVSQITPRKAKAFFINDVKTPISAAAGHLPTVSFLPHEIDLFTGTPQTRRRFFDSILSQVSSEYSQAIHRYGKILKQRNSLIKKISDRLAKEGDLEQWDNLLAREGSLVLARRLELIEVMECTLAKEFQSLGENWNDARIVYKRNGYGRSEQEIEEELVALMLHYRGRDLQTMSTTVGPHRDDWSIEADGRELTSFASRGQQRAAVIALVFLKVSFLEIRRGEKPVILLDDVFSELDDLHQKAVLDCFDDYQVLITATHVPEGIEDAKIWDVEKFSSFQVIKFSG